MDKEQLKYVANLSRLQLVSDEDVMFLEQLKKVLVYMEKINELNTDKVIPTYNTTDANNVFREDIVISSISKEKALQNAPLHNKHFFKVQQVLD